MTISHPIESIFMHRQPLDFPLSNDMTTSFFLTSFGGETSDKERTTSSVVVRRSFPTYDFKPNLCPDNDANSKMQWKTLSFEKNTF